MKVLVNNELKEISLNDPRRGGDNAENFLHDQGALTNGDFTWDEHHEAFRVIPEVLTKWQHRLSARQREIDAKYSNESRPS